MNQKSIHGWFDELCLALPGASKSNKPERDATCYTVGGIAYALYETAKNGKPIISLKFDPAFGDLLRQQYKVLAPGHYMEKEHWNSLCLENEVPDDVIENLVFESHQFVFQSLSKKIRNELLGI